MKLRLRFSLWWLVLIPVVLGLFRLRFDVEVLNLLPPGEPVVQGLKLYQQNFANARELIITLRGESEPTETCARNIAELLRRQTNLVSAAAWEPPWLEHPEQGAELVAYLWLNQSPAAFLALTSRLDPTNLNAVLAASREKLQTSFSPEDIARLSYDPYELTRLPESVASAGAGFGQGQELFSADDGKFRLMFIEARPDLTSYRDCVKWFNAIRQIINASSNSLPSGVALQYTGRPAFVSEIGGGMEHDMGAPSAWTLAVIAVLFYYTHRRWRPLFWLLALLIFILAISLALGGLFYGTLNVVSLGFAAILAGLAEDYAIVLYQESRTHPNLSAIEVRREAAPGIFWSAVTTSGAFLLLNLSGLPGLGQLGSLVAIGIIAAAVVMMYAYLPPLLRKKQDAAGISPHPLASEEEPAPACPTPPTRWYPIMVWTVTLLVLCASLFVLWKSPPRIDKSPDALRPKNSSAYAALEEIKRVMNQRQEPLWVMMQGRNESDVEAKLRNLDPILQRAVTNKIIAGFTLPTQLWPAPQNQVANRPAVTALISEEPLLKATALANGFTTNSLVLLANMFQTWRASLATENVFWPTNQNSQWILDKLTARHGSELLAIGLIHPIAGPNKDAALAQLERELPKAGIWLSGWELLGTSISKLVLGDLPRVLVPILLLVLISLWLAFRSFGEVVLSVVTLIFSALCLTLLMALTGWSWNMMNMMALPLLLGMGVDFSIHIQLALQRHKGDLDFIRRSISRALLLAGSTTIAGFASVAFSSNAGIASLGAVCAAGITICMVVAVYLLPVWWKLGRPQP
jgi:predicted RND superfamily exporter protein